MNNKRLIFLVILFLCLSIGIPFATFAEEEVPDNIQTVYLKTGGVFRCKMAWVEGDVFYIQMRSGMMEFPVESVDVKKTYEEAERINKSSAQEK